MKARFALAVSLIIFATTPALVCGQAVFPTKPIQIFVGMAPGGSLDVLVRTLAQDAKKYLGQEVVFVKSDSPIKTLKDLIDYARQNPGKATYGTPGVGTRSDLAMAAIAVHEGVKINHVPFPGDVPVATAVLGGHIMVGVCSPIGGISHLDAGTLRPTAVIGQERMDLFPNVPTIVELGYPYPLPVVHFLHGPKGMPDAIERKLGDAFEKASQSPVFWGCCNQKHALYQEAYVSPRADGVSAERENEDGRVDSKTGTGKEVIVFERPTLALYR